MNALTLVVPVAVALVIGAGLLVWDGLNARWWRRALALPDVEQGDGVRGEQPDPISLLDGRTSAQQPLRPRTVAPLVRVRGRSSTPQS